MIKTKFKLLIVVLLSSFLISVNAQAFHKTYQGFKNIPFNKDELNKNEAISVNQAKYCSASAKANKTPIINEETNEPQLDEDGKKQYDNYVKIQGYHSTKPKKAIKLIPNLKSLNFKVKKETPLIEVLKMYCVQKTSEQRPSKFKGSYLEEFYTEIAFENGFLNSREDSGDYNKEIAQGIYGEDILKTGIIISSPDAVYYVPDYLIATVEKNNKKASDKKSNDDWINQNKQNLITKIEKKLTEYDKKIEQLKKDRSSVKALLSAYKLDLEKAKDRLEEVFDDADISKSEIKSKKKEIRTDTKKYLKNDELDRFTTSYKKLSKINFDKYDSYLILSKLLTKAKKSNKKKDFITKKKKKLGFIDKFKDIKDKELGSQRDAETIERLTADIKKEIDNLQIYIFGPLQDLEDLDTELSNKLPILQYSIYLFIFVIVISVLIYIYLQSRKISNLRKETESTGKKFSDIEGKLKDTSEKIKLAGRASRGRGQEPSISEPKAESEAPKSPEQIIASKFNDLVSEYNEAIDNFSKVAAFKQKWNGVALSRKERQDGTKTVLINSSRAFEKSEIWCLSFSDKYFAFPGSSVKTNMATYMNLDFEKASRDFKGVFNISTGSSYNTEPCVLRRGGAGFVVERIGKLIFPN